MRFQQSDINSPLHLQKGAIVRINSYEYGTNYRNINIKKIIIC